MTKEQWQELAEYLESTSKDVCKDNECTEEEHNCESYAYITEHGELIDVCASDFFQGWGQADIDSRGQYAALALPWIGNGRELKREVGQLLPEAEGGT